jgi:hypothetical protein
LLHHVAVAGAGAALDVEAVVHPARLGPAALDHAHAVAREADGDQGAVLQVGAVAVHERAQRGGDALDGGLVVQPADDLDAVAAHVHHHAAARERALPEPVRVRPVVCHDVLDLEDAAEGAFVQPLLGAHVARREADELVSYLEHVGGGFAGVAEQVAEVLAAAEEELSA